MALLYKKFSYTYLLSISLVVLMNICMSVRGQNSIEDLCKSTRDPVFCTTVFGTDPRTKGAGVLDLTRVAIDLATTNASNTKNKLHALRLSATNADVKSTLSDCESSYGDVLFVLINAIVDLKKGNFHGVNTAAHQANNDAVYCENVLNSPPLESPITKENNDLQTFTSIIGIASTLLGGRG